MKFCITTETDEAYRSVSNISHPLWQEYCDRHGYDFSVREASESERGPVWERVPHMLQKLSEGYDWVVHVDADTIPTNFHIPLTEFIDNEKSIVISCAPYKGQSIFNDGVFFANGRKFGDLVLQKSWSLNRPEENIFCAQDAMYRLCTGYWREYFSVQPQKRFNSFLWSEYREPISTPGTWTLGDFVLHLPGMTNQRRVELLTEYKERILR